MNKKILIIKTGALGDIISSFHFFFTLKENFPDDEIFLLTQKIYKDAVEFCPVFKKIFYLPEGFNFLKFLKIIKILRRLKFNMICDIQGNIKTNFYSFLIGGRKRYGIYKKMIGRLFLTKGLRIKKRRINGKVFYEKSRKSIFEILGIKKYVKELKIYIPEEKREIFKNFIKNNNVNENKKWIIIHPLTTKGYLAKRWLKKNFAQLADKLIEDGYEVIFVGKGELEYVNDIILKMRTKPKNLVDKTDFYNLCLLIEKASLVITTDSSPLHISSIFGTKSIGIFGPTNPEKICPKNAYYIYKKVDCSPCYKKRCKSMKCMEEIKVENVYDKVKEILKDEDKYIKFN
ncbi:MAG: glycosyltransferase family 9 protein [Candidatus Omnitrophica bacterium]|nr:glycosyltransferase family 9 protein [Candidatus Omnitrophota bacterium]